jgi:uncharacterized protein
VLTSIGYAAGVLWVMRQETRFVFQAVQILGDERPPFPYEQVDLPRPDGARQFAWVMRHDDPANTTWVLYLHGNPSTIASHVNISHYPLLREIGLNVLAPEYRGFGGLDGTLTEAALLTDAMAAYHYLRNQLRAAPSHIVAYGWSLGSAVAVDLGAELQPAAMILEGAPASIADINSQRYPLFFVRSLTRNPFHSIGKIDRIAYPMLFFHSPADEAIPLSEGRRLFDAARGDKTFVEVRGGHITAVDLDAELFTNAIRDFLARHELVERGENTVQRDR